MTEPMLQVDLEGALRTHFGLERFRPLQREIITEVLAGRPVLGIMPTGGGKSLCYQLPALLLPGVTLVISPLISLMKDQVDALVNRGIDAVAINSQDTASETRRKLDQLACGAVKIAFVAPERLRNSAFLEAVRFAQVSLLAVDEAHCVSQWGHDFRPDYRFIRDFHALVGSPPLLALTATAKPAVRDDVAAQLGIEDAPVLSASADRGNLWLGFEACATVAEKRGKVAHLCRESGGSTIVYVSSRKDAESWASMLAEQLGEPVDGYHAGLPAAERTAVQDRFMSGQVRVVVATNAFGMGIDKSDIRAVIHAGVGDSLESYFQEIGRAGRDGLPAICTMVVVPGMDVKLREYLLEREAGDGAGLEQVLAKIAAMRPRGGGTLWFGAEDGGVALLAASHLAALGAVELGQRGPESVEVRITGPLDSGTLNEVGRRLGEHGAQRADRFRRMRSFVYLGDQCRRAYLLQYFGERLTERPAACCSACNPRPLPGGLAVETKKKSRASASPAAQSRRSTEGEGGEASEGTSGGGRVSKEEMIHRAGHLFAAGQTVVETATALGRAETTTWDYFLQWLALDESGAWKLAVRRVISPDAYREIRRELQAQEDGKLKPVMDRLGERYNYNQIRVARTVLLKTGM